MSARLDGLSWSRPLVRLVLSLYNRIWLWLSQLVLIGPRRADNCRNVGLAYVSSERVNLKWKTLVRIKENAVEGDKCQRGCNRVDEVWSGAERLRRRSACTRDGVAGVIDLIGSFGKLERCISIMSTLGEGSEATGSQRIWPRRSQWGWIELRCSSEPLIWTWKSRMKAENDDEGTEVGSWNREMRSVLWWWVSLRKKAMIWRLEDDVGGDEGGSDLGNFFLI